MSIEPGRRMNIASVRILRLALGAALAISVSQLAGWDLSFIAPVFTILILSLPLPAPTLGKALKLVLALSLGIYSGFLLLPVLLHFRDVGVLLLAVALFWSFYYTARGGSPLIGAFLTVGLAMATAVGSMSIDVMPVLAKAVTINALIGLVFVWVAHAVLPDSMARSATAGKAAAGSARVVPDEKAARWSALRSTSVIMPVCLWLLLSSGSAAYVPFMIKVASMAQQASSGDARQVGRSLISSTLIGGTGAIIGWHILSGWPSLGMYAAVIGIAGLIIGKKIFQGTGMRPDHATWSYGYLTLVVILAPAVLDSAAGAAAGAAFWNRLIMFAGATLYGAGAVFVFDAIFPTRSIEPQTAADPG